MAALDRSRSLQPRIEQEIGAGFLALPAVADPRQHEVQYAAGQRTPQPGEEV